MIAEEFSALAYFSLQGRRKKDWNEVLRFRQVLAPYPTEVLRQMRAEEASCTAQRNREKRA